MADDYLVRSGAKELLARAVASLLEIHPANPVRFLAHRFDTKATSVERSVRLLQACPPQGAAFEDALFQAFRWLSAGASPVAEPSLIETLGISVVSTIPRSSYELVLTQLCADFPVHVKDRVLDALRALEGSSSVDGDKDVLMDEFQRGVRVCMLLEELFDVVDELFFSIDKGAFGEVKLAVVLSALENASQQQHTKQTHTSDLADSALAVLKLHLRSRHEVSGLVASTAPEAALSGSGDGGPSPTALTPNDDETHRSLRLVDLQEIVFHAVFTP